MGAIPVVVIGGWDPSGGAGVARDLLTLQKLGVRPSAVITAITSQDARARGRVFPLDPSTVTAQIEAAWPRTPPVVKVGMVYSRA
ncbi:MAG: bifunctional hydroxymethylpyrimidine kinase/phosphomethylpyrimidine kinase, partial [Nitrospirae bacterium]|nr:bifunctional hydroxymethylpyrimidine kinase/phosphomethylpyrimidine kinase [Nitrospirota bacterium]